MAVAVGAAGTGVRVREAVAPALVLVRVTVGVKGMVVGVGNTFSPRDTVIVAIGEAVGRLVGAAGVGLEMTTREVVGATRPSSCSGDEQLDTKSANTNEPTSRHFALAIAKE